MSNNEVVQVTLYSGSSASYVSNGPTYGNVQYQVDWDAVFNGLNKKYNKCYVRVHLSGTGNIAKDGVANSTGFLSLVGLGSSYGFSPDSYPGLIISDIQFNNSSQISAAETGYYINIDTRGQKIAPMCPTPKGTMSNFVVRLFQENNTIMSNTNLSPYVITIIFELFDPVVK